MGAGNGSKVGLLLLLVGRRGGDERMKEEKKSNGRWGFGGDRDLGEIGEGEGASLPSYEGKFAGKVQQETGPGTVRMPVKWVSRESFLYFYCKLFCVLCK